MSKLPIRGLIEDWQPVLEVEGIVICGKILIDDRVPRDPAAYYQEDRILTSQVQAMESGFSQFKTRTSRYRLGKISDEYFNKLKTPNFTDLILDLQKLPIYYVHPFSGEEL